MLRRKIENEISSRLKSNDGRMLIVDGARQVGKSYIIRQVGRQMFKNFIEINFEEDKAKDKVFAHVSSVSDFYIALSSVAGDRLGDSGDTLVFIDEIQVYPVMLTLVKFLMRDRKYMYIASGSQLGIALSNTQSVPVGSMSQLHMYPLDFEEFLLANGFGQTAIDDMRNRFNDLQPLNEGIHSRVMELFKMYLIVGGMPDCVSRFVGNYNVAAVRSVQTDICSLYGNDASKYTQESGRRLKIQRIYEMVVSNMENKKKRMVVKDIEGMRSRRSDDYADEFDYLISSGVCLDVKAISNPTYPLAQSLGKNLLKLYMNDVGLLTNRLYGTAVNSIMQTYSSVNLGSVYETVVAQELKAHGFSLFYYDNKKNGEVDFIIDDRENMSVMPIEVKSGKDYYVHSAIDRLMRVKDYNVSRGCVLSNAPDVSCRDGVLHIPVYYVMFFHPYSDSDLILRPS